MPKSRNNFVIPGPHVVRNPEAICNGRRDGHQVLALDSIPLESKKNWIRALAGVTGS